MGKVSVKHFLNDATKKEQIPLYKAADSTLYPVYLQITYNRKTTKIRSYTNLLLRKVQFEQYLKEGMYDGERMYQSNPTYLLKNEIKYVTEALDYFYNEREEDSELYTMKSVSDFFMSDFDGLYFRSTVNKDTIFRLGNADYDFMDSIIKEDVNIVALTDFFNKNLNVSLSTLKSYRSHFIEAYEMFFRYMPKDRKGRIIGKIINWFTGDTKDIFFNVLKEYSDEPIRLFNKFDEYMEEMIPYNIEKETTLR